MLFIEICVGSSCHLKGSQVIVELMQKEIADRKLEDEIVLLGCFCANKCNRIGVTIKVNDEVFSGITRETFKEFFRDNVLSKLQGA